MPDRNLYDVLEIPNNASLEDVRKAYKKMALKTHPDRLPQGSSVQDKADSEELFRQVNNAYEVLIDPQKRRLYDTHGVWPPPDEDEDDIPSPRHSPHTYRHGPYDRRPFHGMPEPPFFSDPFSATSPRPFSRPSPGRPPHFHFDFTDPYMLFNTIIGDVFGREFGPRTRSTPHRPFHEHDVFGMPGIHTPPLLRPMGIGFPPFGESHGRRSRSANSGTFSYESNSFSAGGGRGGWVSESRSSRTVNGVTESEWRRTDADGNEHVTYTFPDGREKYTINGRDQMFDDHSRNHRDHDGAYLPPPQAYRGIEDSPPPLVRPSRPGGGGSRFRSNFQSLSHPPRPYGIARDREAPVIPEYNSDPRREKRARWWPGGRY